MFLGVVYNITPAIGEGWLYLQVSVPKMPETTRPMGGSMVVSG